MIQSTLTSFTPKKREKKNRKNLNVKRGKHLHAPINRTYILGLLLLQFSIRGLELPGILQEIDPCMDNISFYFA